MRNLAKWFWTKTEFLRWYTGWNLLDWLLFTASGRATAMSVVSATGVAVTHFVGQAWRHDITIVFAVSLIVLVPSVISTLRSKRQPVPTQEADPIQREIADYFAGKTLYVRGEPQTVLTTTTSRVGYVSGFGDERNANTLDFGITLSVTPLRGQLASSEHWSRLDAIRRARLGQALMGLPRTQERMWDVMIDALPQSDCRDLGIDLRDAINNVGLQAVTVQEALHPNLGPGIVVEGHRSDPACRQLCDGLNSIGLTHRFIETARPDRLIIRIGRRTS
jgi:hypothetical protein